MNPLLFLGAAVVLSALGTLVLWARHRHRGGPDSSIDEFRSKMRALSEEPGAIPGSDDDAARRGG